MHQWHDSWLHVHSFPGALRTRYVRFFKLLINFLYFICVVFRCFLWTLTFLYFAFFILCVYLYKPHSINYYFYYCTFCYCYFFLLLLDYNAHQRSLMWELHYPYYLYTRIAIIWAADSVALRSDYTDAHADLELHCPHMAVEESRLWRRKG